jgi:hypothetical protein
MTRKRKDKRGKRKGNLKDLFSFFRFQILSVRAKAVLAFGSQNPRALMVHEPQNFATRNLEAETFPLSSWFLS